MKILFVLGARSEFGYILPVYREAERRGHTPAIWSCNTASLPGFGDVAQSARESGLNVRQIVTTSFDGYSHVAMAKSLGAVTQALADYLGNENYDWVVLSGDRAEQLGAAITSSYMYVPTAHIQAGERSGNIDGLARHAIARLAHVHFAANPDAEERLKRSGEEEWRIVMSGAPQIDGLVETATERNELERKRLVPSSKFVLAVFHPETARLEQELRYLEQLIVFLKTHDAPVVWIAPNNDAGSRSVREIVMANLRAQDYFRENVSRPDFAGILKNCEVIVGNSSAGIIEAPSFSTVAINIGKRQEARFRGKNVIDVDGEKITLEDAFAKVSRLRKNLATAGGDFPYGTGNSSEVIINSLEALLGHSRLTLKQLSY